LLRIDKKAFGVRMSSSSLPKSINKDEIDALVARQPLIKDLSRQDEDVASNPHFGHCPVGLQD
tara:strand:- start:281 stop:469 length:189 start_codon:yes stop_codon:yes gene_type:complete